MTATRKQCKKCPWRKDVDPRTIPNGYCERKHEALRGTIAPPGELRAGPLRLMACHETPVGREIVCVGWLDNQLGPGNNLALRMAAIQGKFPRYELVGEQHETLDDTLPSNQERRRR